MAELFLKARLIRFERSRAGTEVRRAALECRRHPSAEASRERFWEARFPEPDADTVTRSCLKRALACLCNWRTPYDCRSVADRAPPSAHYVDHSGRAP